MILHKRFWIVKKAKPDLGQAVLDVVKKHGLTPTELVGLLMEEIQHHHKYVLRKERHPRHKNKPADEA